MHGIPDDTGEAEDIAARSRGSAFHELIAAAFLNDDPADVFADAIKSAEASEQQQLRWLFDRHQQLTTDDPDLAGLAGRRSTQDEVDAELARIPLVPCLFMFQFIVETDGKSAQDYVVRLGSWGALTMSAANLRQPGSVQLSVGLR